MKRWDGWIRFKQEGSKKIKNLCQIKIYQTWKTQKVCDRSVASFASHLCAHWLSRSYLWLTHGLFFLSSWGIKLLLILHSLKFSFIYLYFIFPRPVACFYFNYEVMYNAIRESGFLEITLIYELTNIWWDNLCCLLDIQTNYFFEYMDLRIRNQLIFQMKI